VEEAWWVGDSTTDAAKTASRTAGDAGFTLTFFATTSEVMHAVETRAADPRIMFLNVSVAATVNQGVGRHRLANGDASPAAFQLVAVLAKDVLAYEWPIVLINDTPTGTGGTLPKVWSLGGVVGLWSTDVVDNPVEFRQAVLDALLTSDLGATSRVTSRLLEQSARHDLKKLLNVLQYQLAGLRRETKPGDRQIDTLDDMRRSVRRIHNLLDVSKQGTQSQSKGLAAESLRLVIKDAVEQGQRLSIAQRGPVPIDPRLRLTTPPHPVIIAVQAAAELLATAKLSVEIRWSDSGATVQLGDLHLTRGWEKVEFRERGEAQLTTNLNRRHDLALASRFLSQNGSELSIAAQGGVLRALQLDLPLEVI